MLAGFIVTAVGEASRTRSSSLYHTVTDISRVSKVRCGQLIGHPSTGGPLESSLSGLYSSSSKHGLIYGVTHLCRSCPSSRSSFVPLRYLGNHSLVHVFELEGRGPFHLGNPVREYRGTSCPMNTPCSGVAVKATWYMYSFMPTEN